MISAASRPYIDASVPVLRAHGLAITTAFYRNLFAELPQMANLFNMGNQANGAQQQSLASAVFAYAANIGNPDALGPVVVRIMHKHVSVGVRAEHYPIVGRHLLGAIAEVLGEAATPALLAAWQEAYDSLARLFIDAERALYASAAIEPGHAPPSGRRAGRPAHPDWGTPPALPDAAPCRRCRRRWRSLRPGAAR
jgi:nitric oxide dioxygenase